MKETHQIILEWCMWVAFGVIVIAALVEAYCIFDVCRKDKNEKNNQVS